MNPNILAGAFLAVVEGMAFRGRRPDAPSREQVAKEVISVLMDGMRLPPTVTKSSSAAPSADLSLPSPAVSSN